MTRTHHLAALVSALALTGNLAVAKEDQFRPPAGCTAFLTEQSLDCGVTHYYRCEGEPDGTTWSAYVTPVGVISVQQTDPDYQWLQGHYPLSGTSETFVPPAADPISTRTLVEDGIDTYDFTLREDSRDGSKLMRIRGWDELTGETVTIDGEELERTRFAIQWLDEAGNITSEGSGSQYFSHSMDQFFLGQESYTDDSGTLEYDDRPVTFTRPGQAGFLSMTPLFNCSTEQARLNAPVRQMKEPAHDL